MTSVLGLYSIRVFCLNASDDEAYFFIFMFLIFYGVMSVAGLIMIFNINYAFSLKVEPFKFKPMMLGIDKCLDPG